MLIAVCKHDTACYLIILCDIGIGITPFHCRLNGYHFRTVRTVIINHIPVYVKYYIFPFRCCVFRRHIVQNHLMRDLIKQKHVMIIL